MVTDVSHAIRENIFCVLRQLISPCSLAFNSHKLWCKVALNQYYYLLNSMIL